MRMLIKRLVLVSSIVSMLVACGLAIAQEKQVTIGLQGNYQPWKAAISDGAFEKSTGYDIDWRQFDSGAKVIAAMASGDVDIAMAGSSPITAAVVRGVNVKLFYIVQGIGESEALIVRPDSGIDEPTDLKGKTIAVPFVSTSHYDVMAGLENWGIETSDLKLLNLQPNQAWAAWVRGDIDGAFVWSPALTRMKDSGGEILITSGDICEQLGKCTFNGMIVRPAFAEANPEFMSKFVALLDEYTMKYRNNPEAWTPDSTMVQKIIDITGGNPQDVPGVLSQYVFLSLEQQASDTWLGGGADTGIGFTLKDTATFLKDQNKIEAVPNDMTTFFTDRWVKAAMAQD